jgi:exodeoxyribonuclease V alpha subunit
VSRDTSDCAAISEAFGRFRVLCAVREGPRGVVAVNERVTRHVRDKLAPLLQPHGLDSRSPWYPGRPVMVLRNDYLLKLFNGDIGIALPDVSGELMVFFPDAGGGFRSVAPVRLPMHQTAFAMTVHKSQGSEFDEVLIVLPEQRSRVLTRELLYTAVTRARKRVVISSGEDVLSAAMHSSTARHSGLLARLQEAASEGARSCPRK